LSGGDEWNRTIDLQVAIYKKSTDSKQHVPAVDPKNQQVHRGLRYFSTPGYSNREIADELHIAEKTVPHPRKLTGRCYGKWLTTFVPSVTNMAQQPSPLRGLTPLANLGGMFLS